MLPQWARAGIARTLAAGVGSWPWSPPAARIGAWLAEPIDPSVTTARRRWPQIAATYCLREYLHRLRPPVAPEKPPDPLELFFRVGPRDLEVAPLAEASLRRYLDNEIVAFTVVTPRAHRDELRRQFPEAAVLADEELLPASMSEAIERAAPAGRAPWVRQQFLTFVYVSEWAKHPCLVWDADLILLRHKALRRGGVAAVAVSLEHHPPYFDFIQRLVRNVRLPAFSSTVAHHIVMEPDLLRELFEEIEQYGGGRPWWRLLLDALDVNEPSCISDYELYGQWLRNRHPARVTFDGFRNVGISRDRLSDALLTQLARRKSVDSVSLHWWI
jgi:hypothetical protein